MGKGSSHVNSRAKSCESGRIHRTAESGEFAPEVHEFQRLERSYLMLAENEEWMAGNHDKINIRGADENSYGDAVPASDGSGEPGLSMSGWFGFFAPKGTPKDIIAKLNGAMVEALADPAVRKRFADLGLDVAPREPEQTPEGLATFQKAEIEKWWPIIKAAGIGAQAL
jgi:Tripartite tricarboxylate transporter family receptor